jgi:hypothetical protein
MLRWPHGVCSHLIDPQLESLGYPHPLQSAPRTARQPPVAVSGTQGRCPQCVSHHFTTNSPCSARDGHVSPLIRVGCVVRSLLGNQSQNSCLLEAVGFMARFSPSLLPNHRSGNVPVTTTATSTQHALSSLRNHTTHSPFAASARLQGQDVDRDQRPGGVHVHICVAAACCGTAAKKVPRHQ